MDFSLSAIGISVEALRRHEGFRAEMYKCPAGYWTIGYGHNLEHRAISKEVADLMLFQAVEDTVKELNRRLPFFSSLDNVRQSVLINMGFNLGVNGLLKFRKMIDALEEKNYDLAAHEMLDSKWATQVGSRATELAFMMKAGANEAS